MNEEDTKAQSHFYDGIEEQDNVIPGWFAVFFLGGVLFGMLYFSYYAIWGGPTLREEYDRAMLAQQMLRQSIEIDTPKATPDELFALAKDPGEMKSARSVFASKCVACHAAEGQGGIGPNLTDSNWLHGGKISEIRDTIANGVVEKGMPPWGSMLATTEVNSLAAFIHNLKGTHPKNAKEAQGALVGPE